MFSLRLIGRLSDHTVHPLTEGGLIHPDQWVLSRALCSFRRITLANGSRDALKAAVLQAARQAPAEKNEAHIEQDIGNKKAAGLWTWAALEHDGESLKAGPLSAIPETLARQPLDTGIRLVQCLEGVEGQVWEAGVLLASRWWPAPPQQNQWAAFLRASRVNISVVSVDVPDVAQVPWRTHLPVFNSTRDTVRAFATPARCFFAVMMLLTSMLVYNGAQYVRYAQSARSLEAKNEDRKKIVSDVLAERNKAVENLQAIDRLARMGTNTALLQGVAAILEKVQGEGMRLARFTLIDGQLSVRLYGKPETRGAALVSLLEADEAVREISVNFKFNDEVEVSALLSANTDLLKGRDR